MVRVSSVAVRAMTALGDLEYGGAGSPVSYVNAARDGQPVAYFGGAFSWGGAGALFDGSYAVTEYGYNAARVLGLNLNIPRRIGRYRFVQGNGDAHATSWVLESADAEAGPYTVRHTQAAEATDVQAVLAAPVTARYWRVRATAMSHGGLLGGGSWLAAELELDEVTTVGAGQPARLAPPPERRILGYDPSAGVPQWAAPGAAEADLAAAPGIAVNDASATLVVLKSEHDLTIAKLNAIIAKLEALGILAP